ncbi:MAG: hypothetical protein VKK98_04700 [Cyanobacteriota bacterium]|nr:hypothetical protein [Cyanobacteriota bacterium]
MTEPIHPAGPFRIGSRTSALISVPVERIPRHPDRDRVPSWEDLLGRR